MIAEADLIRLFAEGMEARGYAVARHESRLEHPESGIEIHPHALEPIPYPPSVRTIVVVAVHHPRFPSAGIVEFQHAVHDTEIEAIRRGIDQWLQMDFIVLLDSLRDRPERCQMLQWDWPDDPSRKSRRALLGPIGHMIQYPERVPKDADHPYCPCCLLTNSLRAFLTHLQTDALYGIRLLASRDDDGFTEADCRINGAEWEAGKEALRAYAKTWPPAGIEMRKQYVVLQSAPRSVE